MDRAGSGDDWVTLFDGTTLAAWRGYGRAEPPGGWRIMDRSLGFEAADDAASRGDIMTRESFGDFELELDWRISEGGNSGIIFLVEEGHPESWHTGPEIQVLDDARHVDASIPSHRAGALYDLVVPPPNATRPVGEWNRTRLIVCGGRIRHWLNDILTVDITVGSEDWSRRLAASKFAEMPAFARASNGHIVLQDHADPVWYRNIRIRPIRC